MPKSVTVTLPFECDFDTKHFIECSPRLCYGMKNGDPEEIAALAKIADKLVQEDARWGFYIPLRFGFSITEKRRLKESEEKKQKFSMEGLQIVRKIAQDTGKDIQVIMNLLGSNPADMVLDEAFEPYTDEILGYSRRFNEMDESNPWVTELMRRVNPEWTDEDTRALPEPVLVSLEDLVLMERTGGVDDEDNEGKPPLPSATSTTG